MDIFNLFSSKGLVFISLLIQHYVDASVIFAIILLNTSLGFIQQYKAEKSMLELKKFNL